MLGELFHFLKEIKKRTAFAIKFFIVFISANGRGKSYSEEKIAQIS